MFVCTAHRSADVLVGLDDLSALGAQSTAAKVQVVRVRVYRLICQFGVEPTEPLVGGVVPVRRSVAGRNTLLRPGLDRWMSAHGQSVPTNSAVS